LIIVPVGIALTVRLIPAELMVEFRREAASREAGPRSRAGAIGIILLWGSALVLAG